MAIRECQTCFKWDVDSFGHCVHCGTPFEDDEEESQSSSGPDELTKEQAYALLGLIGDLEQTAAGCGMLAKHSSHWEIAEDAIALLKEIAEIKA